MNTVLNPIVSEFDTSEQAASHDQWFRLQVQKALDNTEPRVAQAEVMADMRKLIASKRDKQARAG